MTERIHPHPKMWLPAPNGSSSGEYRIHARKRGGVCLLSRGERIFEAPTAKVAKMFAVRHAAGEMPTATIP